MEIWKKIPGFPDEYEASSLGRIRCIGGNYETTYCGKPVVRKKRVKVYDLKKLSQKGYQRINIFKKINFVHRLVLLAFVPNPLNLTQCNHKNGIKTDNRIENLEWVTNYQNRQHAVTNGLHATGVKVKARKYSPAIANEMLALKKSGMSIRQIGIHFGTTHSAIIKVLSRPDLLDNPS